MMRDISSVAYDATGRRVAEPRPGAYFVREQGRMRKAIIANRYVRTGRCMTREAAPPRGLSQFKTGVSLPGSRRCRTCRCVSLPRPSMSG